MRAKCESCGAQYEIDSSKVPSTGLAVKCTKCQNLFIVRPPVEVETVEVIPVEAITAKPSPKPKRPSSPSLYAQPEPEPVWILRRPEGKTYPFRDISVLQRWIVEHKALQTDEVTDDGGVSWKPLAELRELAPFFQIVERATNVAMEAVTETPPELVRHTAEVASSADVDVQQAPKMTLQMWAAKQEIPSGETKSVSSASLIAESPIKPPLAPVQEQPITSEESSIIIDLAGSTLPPKEEIPEEKQAVPLDEQQQDTQITAVEEQDAPAQINEEPIQEAAKEEIQEQTVPAFAQPQPKTVPVQSAFKAPVNDPAWTKESDYIQDKWDDYAAEITGQGKGKSLKIVVGILIALAVIATVVFFAFPDLFKKKPGEAEQKSLSEARTMMNFYTMDNLAKAETLLTPTTTQFPDFVPAIAMLSEINASKADLIQMTMTDLEKQYKDINKRFSELEKQYKDETKKLSQEEKDNIFKELESTNKQLEGLRTQIEPLNAKFNEAMKKAGDQARRAWELDNGNMEANRAFAEVYRIGGNVAKANEMLEKAMSVNAEDPVSLYVRGTLCMEDEGLLAEALKAFQSAIMKDPNLMKAKLKLAKLRRDQGQPEEARLLLTEILQKAPSMMEAKLMLDGLGATASAKEQVAGTPPAQPIEEKKADEKGEENKTEEGGKTSEASTGLSYEASMKKAEALRRSDRPKDAMNNYQNALKQKDTAEAHAGLGFCYFDLQNFQGALDQFKKALNLDGKNQNALIGLAMSYDELGNKEQAKNWYTKYLDAYPSGEDAIAAKNALKRLE